MKQLSVLWADESGATAVEYGLMVAGIAAVIITIVFALGRKVEGEFTSFDTAMP
ncbi:MAG TPA: Flp family type IVb pilin [Myxococcales bacterium]|jgi:pilus assembly protein Flp/PilA